MSKAIIVFAAMFFVGCRAEYVVYSDSITGIFTCKKTTDGDISWGTVKICTNKEDCIKACNEAIEKDSRQ